MLDPRRYIDQCKHDVCMCGRLDRKITDCECAAFTTYARDCSLRGNVTLNWRTDQLCRMYNVLALNWFRLLSLHIELQYVLDHMRGGATEHM